MNLLPGELCELSVKPYRLALPWRTPEWRLFGGRSLNRDEKVFPVRFYCWEVSAKLVIITQLLLAVFDSNISPFCGEVVDFILLISLYSLKLCNLNQGYYFKQNTSLKYIILVYYNILIFGNVVRNDEENSENNYNFKLGNFHSFFKILREYWAFFLIKNLLV